MAPAAEANSISALLGARCDDKYRLTTAAMNALPAPVCFDVNCGQAWGVGRAGTRSRQPVLDRTTILKLSVDDADVLFGLRIPRRSSRRRSGPTPCACLPTAREGRGSDDLGGVEDVPAFPIEPVEPTGAGDAFMAAVVSRYLSSQRAPSRADIEFASAAGAITATRIGAIESLPTRAEIDQFLISR